MDHNFLVLYKDGLMIAGTTESAITTFKKQITATYGCEDLATLDKILNMKVARTPDGGLFLSQ